MRNGAQKRALSEGMVSSFWFLPGLLTVGAFVLFGVTLNLERLVPSDVSGLPLVFSGGSDAARTVLSVISGSVMTVVATVFSLTIVALQLASAAYSPRLLRNFTSDRGLQVVLGTYIGTFAYSLLVLRVIRTATGETEAFIPVISITTAVVLALVCVVLLVYFIHHIANLIQSSSIVSEAHADAARSLAKLRTRERAPGGGAPDGDTDPHPRFNGLLREKPLVVRSRASGYVQHLDGDSVLRAVAGGAEEMVVEIPCGPGHFVSAGLPLVQVRPAPKGGLDRESAVHEAFFLGKERSFRQDFAFGLRQLSDIALKGVSPGVNDPTTSMQAMDRMEAILVALGEKVMPPRVVEREVEACAILLRVGYYDFDDVVGLAFDQLRRAAFASGQVAVLERLLQVLERSLPANDLAVRQKALWDRAFAVGRMAPAQVPDPRDAVALALRAVEVGAPLLETGLAARVGADLEELDGFTEGLAGGERVREAVQSARGASD
ncbi:hypothetical protein BH18ACT11_BH18ACT11_00350 [soil metagenome]